jgi:hypothetical protein
MQIGKKVRLLLPALVAACALVAHAEHQFTCSASTLKGDYAFSIAGNAQTPLGVVEIHGVALT